MVSSIGLKKKEEDTGMEKIKGKRNWGRFLAPELKMVLSVT